MVEEVVVEAWQKNSVVAVEELRLVVEVVGGTCRFARDVLVS